MGPKELRVVPLSSLSLQEAAEALTAVIVLFTIVSVLLAVMIAVVLLWTQITAIWRALRERLGKKGEFH